MFTTPRDLVILNYKEKVEHNYYYVFKSIEVPEIPPCKEYVRSIIHMGGYIITPLSDEKC